jgi:hypothetical protein
MIGRRRLFRCRCRCGDPERLSRVFHGFCIRMLILVEPNAIRDRTHVPTVSALAEATQSARRPNRTDDPAGTGLTSRSKSMGPSVSDGNSVGLDIATFSDPFI